jgi:hypothetical protein
MGRGRRFRKSDGGELEVNKQDVVASDEAINDQSVVASDETTGDRSVVASD